MLVLAGDPQAVSRGFDQVIFPPIGFAWSHQVVNGIQDLDPAGSVWWLSEDNHCLIAGRSMRLENDALNTNACSRASLPAQLK